MRGVDKKMDYEYPLLVRAIKSHEADGINYLTEGKIYTAVAQYAHNVSHFQLLEDDRGFKNNFNNYYKSDFDIIDAGRTEFDSQGGTIAGVLKEIYLEADKSGPGHSPRIKELVDEAYGILGFDDDV